MREIHPKAGGGVQPNLIVPRSQPLLRATDIYECCLALW